MKDLIDERNFREKCRRSIVKGYNVHYVTKEELEAMQSAGENENEAERPGQESVSPPPALSETAETGSATLDGEFVRDDDPVTREQIEKILGEKEENLQHTIDGLKG